MRNKTQNGRTWPVGYFILARIKHEPISFTAYAKLIGPLNDELEAAEYMLKCRDHLKEWELTADQLSIGERSAVSPGTMNDELGYKPPAT